MMDLSKISTAELVQELSKREAVEKLTVEPYQPYSITVGENTVSESGPIVILRIWDWFYNYLLGFYNKVCYNKTGVRKNFERLDCNGKIEWVG